LLLYDISDRNSFDSIRTQWCDGARLNANENVIFAVIGMKTDLTPNQTGETMIREVTLEEGEALAEEISAMFFMECSSKTGENVEMIVMRLVVALVHRFETLSSNLPGITPPPQGSVQRETCVIF
jgi:GTPase SAR1 family protein